MKVKVDEDLCVGTANCVQDCPTVFELVNGISHVKVAEVPAGEEDNVQQAVDDCPVSAIEIIEG